MIASVCEICELRLSVCLAICPRPRGGFLREPRPAPRSILGVLGHTESEPFVMNAHGLNSFVFLQSACGL